MAKNTTTTKIVDIVSYWEKIKYEGDLGVDWADAHERCWRCGCEARLQKCHITPHSIGGEDKPSNLVLMCCRCHKEAPNSNDEEMIWDWIKATKIPYYDIFWSYRGLQEYEKIYNKKFGADFGENPPTIPKASMKKMVETAFDKTSVHFGEGGCNTSTLASVVKDVEAQISKYILKQTKI